MLARASAVTGGCQPPAQLRVEAVAAKLRQGLAPKLLQGLQGVRRGVWEPALKLGADLPHFRLEAFGGAKAEAAHGLGGDVARGFLGFA